MSTNVTLTWAEWRHATTVGVERYCARRTEGARQPDGQDEDRWHSHIEGAWGEAAVAKVTGHYWAGAGQLTPDHGKPDVGPYHVRTTRAPDGRLILRPEDADTEPFVLVVVRHLPSFTIVGWCRGAEGKLPEYQRAPNGRPPAWFVPRTVLRPLTTSGVLS